MSGRAAKPGMIEREHYAWGALLKYVEVLATAYRYDRYLKSSKTGKKLDRLITAIRELREQLNHEYGWVATEHLIPKDCRDHEGRQDWREARIKALRSDVYNGKEMQDLKAYVFCRLAQGLSERTLFHSVVEKAFLSTQVQAQRLPWESTAAGLPSPILTIPAAKADRYADLRLALLENPDQPQAAFVAGFHVHPNTVRRCRRELEEAGVIPYLAHRHAAHVGGGPGAFARSVLSRTEGASAP